MPLIVPPAGVSPLSFFEESPTDKLPPPPTIRADKIEHPGGEYESLIEERHPIDAQVADALTIVRASGAAVTEDGHRFRDVRKLDSTASSLLENEARFALRLLVQRGDIRIDDISTIEGPDWSELAVNYFNLRDISNTSLRTLRRRIEKEET